MAQLDTSRVPTERTAAPAREEGFVWSAARTYALLVLCLATLIELIDVTIVNVTLPTMQDDLGFTADSLPWVVNGYLVTFAGFLLLGGRLGDLFGRRRVFLAGVALFLVASVASGLATNATMLIVTRLFQGVTAAFIAPMTLAIIMSIFPEGLARNRAISMWGAIGGVSGSLGVTIGGLLDSGPGWRWIFFVNIPICLFILAIAPRYIPADRPAHRHHSFDVVGSVVVTGGVGLLSYAISQTSEHSWSSGRSIGLLAGAAVLLAYFVVHELRIAREPLVSLSIFRIRSVAAANTFSTLGGASLFGVFFLVSLRMQQVLHYSPIKTGLMYLPLTGAIMVFAGIAPLLVPRLGVRYTVAMGSVIAAGGLFLFSRATPTSGVWTSIVLPSIITGGGMAIWYIPMTIAAVAGVPTSAAGLASGLATVTRTVGGAIGVAIVASAAATRTTHLLGSGHSEAAALSDGFKLGFVIISVIMAAGAVAAVALFRAEGRGEKFDMAGAAAAGVGE
ncbi:MFS transporter [Frankia sp. AgB32]|uniref:MFS transporter n=1 Tax=Frankia sp. AgB32 TaxID=631119 RepID=UPI00200D8516|nr:MFS transporter [Frankia sp. AgB32]MCK9897087.1 MFS transporter [Frankia sp. AgB32]